ncbi:hypothetical protein LUZ60_005960 [Juncus effusus]|nr:hypothetical protein LUZ60_005960 [Juncus effusus]
MWRRRSEAMSRREDRDRRTRFRPEREPSPKRSRRDREREEKRTTERSYYPKNRALNSSSSFDLRRENKPKETERLNDSKRPIDGSKAGSESKIEGASDPKDFAHSKFYFQHDDQGRQGGRVHIHHETDNGRSELKESKSEDKSSEKMKEKKNDESAWTHDRYLELEYDRYLELVSNSKPINQRPSFTEKKMKEPYSSSLNAAKNEERNAYNNNYNFERRGKSFGRGNRNGIRIGNINGNRIGNRRNGNENKNWRGNGNLGFRGPIRGIGERNLEQRNEVQNEKWKHDKYEQLSKRNPVNEEEQISKIEALLAS